jgi:hypothetical protein
MGERIFPTPGTLMKAFIFIGYFVLAMSLWVGIGLEQAKRIPAPTGASQDPALDAFFLFVFGLPGCIIVAAIALGIHLHLIGRKAKSEGEPRKPDDKP